jgi:uncharacterized RDD family membrane protein YckC
MTDVNGTRQTVAAQGMFPRVALPQGALDGVRTRRIFAVMVDFIVVAMIVSALWVVLTVATLGLALVLLPPLFPIVAFFYNGLAVSGANMGTPGMRLFDLSVRTADTGGRVPFINAAVHGVLFYVSWMFPFVLLISLFTSDKRCLHDMFSGVIVTRR